MAIGCSALLALIHVVLIYAHVDISEFWHHAFPIVYVVLFFIGLRKPAHTKLLEINPDIKPLLYVIEWFVFVSVALVYWAVRYLPPTYFIIISVFISGTIVSIGWWVQSIIATARQRRQHTVNTIIQTRVSDVYQSNLKQFNRHFSSTEIHINKSLARHFAKYRSVKEFSKRLKANNLSPKNVEASLYGAMYLLNFFEFISAGIQKRDLDNTLLQECFKDVVRNLERKCFHLLWYYRENQMRADVFKEFEYLCINWLGEQSLLGKSRKGERLDKSSFGKAYPPTEYLKKPDKV